MTCIAMHVMTPTYRKPYKSLWECIPLFFLFLLPLEECAERLKKNCKEEYTAKGIECMLQLPGKKPLCIESNIKIKYVAALPLPLEYMNAGIFIKQDLWEPSLNGKPPPPSIENPLYSNPWLNLHELFPFRKGQLCHQCQG